MKFERLKKSYKKEIIIGALAVCIVSSALTFATTKAKYKLTESIDLVKGTINYKPYDFKIMAMYQQNDSGDYTEINTMPSSGYIINEDKTYCTTDNKTQVKGKAYTNDSGELVFKNLTKSDKCYLYFDVKTITIPEIIATLNAKTTAPDFSQSATTDEGVYKAADGMYGGYSYYWRGAVTNNYVKFAGFCWRIIRINGDGSLRLIYDGSTCHVNGTKTAENIAISGVKYNIPNDQSNYAGWTYSGTLQRPSNNATGTSSNAKTQIENWYNSNMSSYDSFIDNGKFCNDRNISSGETWSINGEYFYYAAYTRIRDGNPTLSCSNGDLYTLKIGLITADEVVYAGGKDSPGNNQYYLYNGQYYWTMSPERWHGTGVTVAVVYGNGMLGSGNNIDDTYGIRPVINLKADTTLAGGTGTQTNPYVVK